MKKRLIALVCVSTLVLAMTSLSFAHGNGRGGYGNGFGHGYGHMYQSDLSEEELEALHDERMEDMKETIAKYLKDGKITQEHHDNWLQHIEDMDAYHEENGFTPGAGRGFGGGFGGCHNYVPSDSTEE